MPTLFVGMAPEVAPGKLTAMVSPMSQSGSNNEEIALQQQLVAYLDGELDAQQSRQIEQLLASDPKARESLRELDHAWNLLDELDTAAVDDNLTQTTLETVAMEVNRDSLRAGKTVAGQRRRRLLVGLSLIAAATAGFMTFSLVLSKQNAKLAEDLPLLRNLDYYRQTDDVELLRALDKEGLFAADDTAEQLPAWVEAGPRQLYPAEVQELARRFQQFKQMPPERQNDIRRLHGQLQADSDSARLEQVMRQYVDWLVTRSPQVRAGLFDVPADQRVKAIARILSKQAVAADKNSAGKNSAGKKHGGKKHGGKAADGHMPEGRAMQGVLKWFSQYAMRHEAEIRKAAAEEKSVAGQKRPGQHSRAAVAVLLRKLWQVRPGTLPFSTDNDLKQVLAAMPDKSRKKIESKPPEKQWQTVATWVKGAMNNRPGMNKRTPTPLQQEKRLNQFFEKMLSDRQRRRLTELSSEEFDRELRKLYQERLKQSKKPSRKPGQKKPSGASAKHRAAGGGNKPPATRPVTRP